MFHHLGPIVIVSSQPQLFDTYKSKKVNKTHILYHQLSNINVYNLFYNISWSSEPRLDHPPIKLHLLQGQRFGWINTTGFNDLQDLLSAELKCSQCPWMNSKTIRNQSKKYKPTISTQKPTCNVLVYPKDTNRFRRPSIPAISATPSKAACPTGINYQILLHPVELEPPQKTQFSCIMLHHVCQVY